MKRFFSIVIALMLFSSVSLTAFATEGSESLPSGINYSNIEEIIDAYVKEHEDTTAALSVGVFTGHDVLMEKAYGYSNLEKKIMNNKDTVFEWGSITKLLVWTSVMQLVEKGEIDLKEDIRTYLPDGFLTKLRFDTPITMLNLMNHNAGWQETLTDLFIEDKSGIKELGDALKLIEPEQVNEPGMVVAYSNWGSALAGYIVERVSGQSFDAYVHEYIFKPLDMEHTALNAELSDNEWVASKRLQQNCYTAKNESLGTSNYYLSLYPAGMATGTISDFIKFAQAFLIADEKKSILFNKTDTLKEMLSPSLFFSDGTRPRNSHGFWADEFSVPVLWHNGGTVGSSSWFAFDPVSNTGMVILTNQSGESIYNCGLLPLVFGKYEPAEYRALTKDISGNYVPARTIFKGFGKPYSLISQMQFATNGKGGFSIAGTDSNLTVIGKDSYLLDMGGLKQYIIYSSIRKDGKTILEMPGSDYIKVNGYGVIAKYALLLLFILSVLYSLFSIIISLIRFLKHKNTPGIIGNLPTVINVSVTTTAGIYIYLTLKLFSSVALLQDIKWSIILNGVLALLPVIYTILLAAKWKTLDCTRNEKRKLIMTSIAGIIMTINVIYWDSYKF